MQEGKDFYFLSNDGVRCLWEKKTYTLSEPSAIVTSNIIFLYIFRKYLHNVMHFRHLHLVVYTRHTEREKLDLKLCEELEYVF